MKWMYIGWERHLQRVWSRKRCIYSIKKSVKSGKRFGLMRYHCPVATQIAVKKANGFWCFYKSLEVKFASYERNNWNQKDQSNNWNQRRVQKVSDQSSVDVSNSAEGLIKRGNVKGDDGIMKFKQ